MTKTFAVEARGVGRSDYSQAVEYATQPYITPTLRQARFSLINATFLDVTLPYPFGYKVPILMPQEDGSFGWLASAVVLHWVEIGMFIKTNHLVALGLRRYANIADYLAGVVAQRSPHIFKYGNASISFSKGIPTQVGSIYAIWTGAWPDTATYQITLTATGILTDLTPPWMV